MTQPHDVAVFAGSLRKESFSRKMARACQELAPPSLALTLVEIGELALYNQDLDVAPPPAWVAFRERVHKAAAFLFVTPEYNRSVPGVLKNAIDVGSRPYGKSAWAGGRPGAIISISPGNLGGFGANHHLRQSLVFLNVVTLQQPEAYINGADKIFDPSGKLTDERTRDFVTKYLASFATFIEKEAP
jgi:chromate reductase